MNDSIFCDIKNLTKIIVSPENQRFSFIDDKFLVFKSDENDENFDSKLQIIDELSFSFSSITCISLPSRLTEIGSKAFYLCSNLKTVKFASDSNLVSISDEASYHSSIESISNPSSVTRIGSGAFLWCKSIKLNQLVQQLAY